MKFIYRFFCFDGEDMFAYTIPAENIKRAERYMRDIMYSDFPEYDIIDVECLNSAATFSGELYKAEYIDNLDVREFSAMYNELYGGEA